MNSLERIDQLAHGTKKKFEIMNPRKIALEDLA